MRVVFTRYAKRQLAEIKTFYNRGQPGNKGRRFAGELLRRVQELPLNPEIGVVEENLRDLGLGHRAFIIEKRFKIIYFIDAENIVVTDIFDVRQDPSAMRG